MGRKKTDGTAALQLATITVGDWVRCRKTLAYGQVTADTGKTVSVQWANGETTRDSKDSLELSGPANYYRAILDFAITELCMSETDVFAMHGPIANGRDKMSLAVLSELEEKLLSMSTVEVDEKYEDVAEALFEQPQQAEVFDIFAAYGIGDPEDPKHETALPAVSGAESSTDGAAKSGDTAPTAAAATGGESIAYPACPYQPDRSALSNTCLSTIDGECNSKEVRHDDAPQNGATQLGGTGTASEQPQADSVECDDTAAGSLPAVRTDAGLVDPETGMLIEESLIKRKFGWTELPKLPTKESTTEEVRAFEAKLDQVLDHVLGMLDQVSRWTAANEQRCKPLVEAAEFYNKSFIEPMGRALAKVALPVYKSGAKAGEYSKKTLNLKSGCIEFESAGGYYVADSKLVKEHIEKEGIEKFTCINAERVITYDYNKLLSALKNGTLEKIPGTGHNNKDPLAKVKPFTPKPPKDKAKQEGGGCSVTCPEACPNHVQLKISGEK